MTDTTSPAPLAERSRAFAGRRGPRYGWHHQPGSDFVPPIYATLSDAEWNVLERWYDETDEQQLAGEANVPFMCFLQGFVMGNMIRRVVQLGTYVGYSTLLLGFMLRRMGARNALVTFDIGVETNSFTDRWVREAGLTEQVLVRTGDSADPRTTEQALAYLGAPPQLLIIDSSHQYAHTLDELQLWFPVLPPGSLLVMHDSSRFARQYDATGRGGVQQALSEWAAAHADEISFLNLGPAPEGQPATYLDPCGLALVQKL